eukprot:GHRR01014106.1.p3 GENE.GHRR01014106.1~~GHRR01014106.1.p3  ORF type:complete len:113 (+),score=30.83 GHRR01014106.1:579-917(+)
MLPLSNLTQLRAVARVRLRLLGNGVSRLQHNCFVDAQLPAVQAAVLCLCPLGCRYVPDIFSSQPTPASVEVAIRKSLTNLQVSFRLNAWGQGLVGAQLQVAILYLHVSTGRH